MQTSTSIGIGAGVVGAIGTYMVGSHLTDGIAKRHPTGSGADGPARLTEIGLGVAGAAGIGAGMYALSRGNLTAGAAAIGGGIGAILGAVGTGIGFGVKHGIGVETEAHDIFSNYNRDFDNKLDLYPGWRTPENVRREENRHYDSDGDYTYSTYNYYDIHRLTDRANVNHDGAVTEQELLDTLRSYDANGDGRLQGPERSKYERELGEQAWWGNWVF